MFPLRVECVCTFPVTVVHREARWKCKIRMHWTLPWLRSDVRRCRYNLYHSPWGLETKPRHYLSSMGSLGVLTSTAIRVGGGQITSINISSEKLKKQESVPTHVQRMLSQIHWVTWLTYWELNNSIYGSRKLQKHSAWRAITKPRTPTSK